MKVYEVFSHCFSQKTGHAQASVSLTDKTSMEKLMKSLFNSKNKLTLVFAFSTLSFYTLTPVLDQDQSVSSEKTNDDFRNYNNAPDHVKEFYRQNHEHQTVQLVLQKRAEFCALKKAHMTVWEAIALLDTIKDESDPDLIDRPQSYHAYQTAEALRRDGQPDWLILTGFIHDLGKILTNFEEPQWAVVGDTFPVGCAFSKKIIFHGYFENNPDYQDVHYNSQYGIYQPACGLDNVLMSWGHDEYLYQVLKNSNLPKEALFVIRYHSFYAAHQEGEYQHLMSEEDKKMLTWLKTFQQYDLYSKDINPPNIQTIKPYYQELVNKFLPGKFNW